MNRNEQDRYYHSGLGAENRRDWDRSTRDGDYGRDYENRFRTDEDRMREVRRSHFPEADHRSDRNTANYGPGSDYYGRSNANYRRGYNTPDYVARMQEDRELLRRHSNSGNDRTSTGFGGYSGSAFGGSNYSSHGDFGGSEEYGSMSGDQGNVDDYVSMSGYGGGRARRNHHRDDWYERSNRYSPGRRDRGGYRNYDPNNRWND